MSDYNKLTKNCYETDFKTFLLSYPLASDDSDDPDYSVDSSQSQSQSSSQSSQSSSQSSQSKRKKKNLLNNIWVLVMVNCNHNKIVEKGKKVKKVILVLVLI